MPQPRSGCTAPLPKGQLRSLRSTSGKAFVTLKVEKQTNNPPKTPVNRSWQLYGDKQPISCPAPHRQDQVTNSKKDTWDEGLGEGKRDLDSLSALSYFQPVWGLIKLRVQGLVDSAIPLPWLGRATATGENAKTAAQAHGPREGELNSSSHTTHQPRIAGCNEPTRGKRSPRSPLNTWDARANSDPGGSHESIPPTTLPSNGNSVPRLIWSHTRTHPG